MTIFLAHSKVQLALHTLKAGKGHPLLTLQALGGATPGTVPEELMSWRRPIYGLDFTGHGQSSIPFGGGYTAEVLMGDEDVALCQVGPCTVAQATGLVPTLRS